MLTHSLPLFIVLKLEFQNIQLMDHHSVQYTLYSCTIIQVHIATANGVGGARDVFLRWRDKQYCGLRVFVSAIPFLTVRYLK